MNKGIAYEGFRINGSLRETRPQTRVEWSAGALLFLLWWKYRITFGVLTMDTFHFLEDGAFRDVGLRLYYYYTVKIERIFSDFLYLQIVSDNLRYY